MKTESRQYLIYLSTFPSFGPMRLELLFKYFKSPKRVWNLSLKNLSEVGIKREMAVNFVSHRENFNPSLYTKRLKELNINCVSKYDDTYPKHLKDLPNAPILLYVMGELSNICDNAVAIVGTRKASSYGREVATKFSSELSALGVTVVSGLARGIDSYAHIGSIEAGGKTIAVVGSGLDRIYPPENISLARKISKDFGAVISEYPLGYPALRTNFANRNRIISGISRIVLVVEGQKKSGTLLTATHAAEQGKSVFAVPGQITSPLSEAPHFLLQNGARLATSVSDILAELDLEININDKKMEDILPENKTERKIFSILENEKMHIDEISRILKLTVSEVSSVLMMMELKGKIRNLGSGEYKLR
jgi:DNA processing protein